MNENSDQPSNDPKIDQTLASASAGIRSDFDTLRAIFSDLGLQPAEAAGIGIIKYEGEINGRMVTMVATVRSRTRYSASGIDRRTYQGMMLDIGIGSAAKTRLHLLPPYMNWLQRFTMPRKGNQRLTALGALYDQFHVWAHDPEWAKAYLSHAKVQSLIKRYYFDADGRPVEGSPFWKKLLNSAVPSLVKIKRDTTYMLNHRPSSFNLAISNPVLPFTLEQFQEWLDQLFELAAIAESPLPRVAELTKFEKMPAKTRAYIFAFSYLFGGMFLLLACCACPLILMLSALALSS